MYLQGETGPRGNPGVPGERVFISLYTIVRLTTIDSRMGLYNIPCPSIQFGIHNIQTNFFYSILLSNIKSNSKKFYFLGHA